jgi:hypothetical protein
MQRVYIEFWGVLMVGFLEHAIGPAKPFVSGPEQFFITSGALAIIPSGTF